MKSGSFELVPGFGEQGPGLGRNWESGLGELPVDVEHPEADALHVERLDGPGERLALVQERGKGIGGLSLEHLDERKDLALGGKSMIRSRRRLHRQEAYRPLETLVKAAPIAITLFPFSFSILRPEDNEES